MIGAGTFISPLIKIVTTVAILGAVYLFIVKPTLDTTETISKSIDNSIGQSFDSLSPQIQESVRQARKLQRQQQEASQAQLQEANKLLSCIQQANQDVDKITRCNARYSP